MSYTKFDRMVALWRFRAALPYIGPASRVCDIGCGPGAPFLRHAHGRIAFGVGLDHRFSNCAEEHARIVLCDITQVLPLVDGFFHHATMLADLEHLKDPTPTLREAFRILAADGSLILTWPRQMVDPILHPLRRIGLVSEAMESERHERRIPLEDLLVMLRKIGFGKFVHRTFELGLNHLLVAYKVA